jgi:hypothetical protein
MSSTKMFVPDKIKVGYQKRNDTYTGKLAYVIYFDNKGKLRKESSWESWRDKKIAPKEFPNDPTDGFVLNKGVGGARQSWSSNARNEYVRVYDPRGFEFEISVANLLFILQENSSIKGKGLEGEFVYSWDGAELVLLPIGCVEYGECKSHTARQSKKIVAKDVKAGHTYVMKNGTNVLYLGKYPYSTSDNWKGFSPIGNRHIFLDLDAKPDKYSSPYIVDTGFAKLAEAVSQEAISEYPAKLDKFKKSKYYGEISKFKLIPSEIIENHSHYYNHIVSENNKYYLINISKSWNYTNYGWTVKKSAEFIPELKDNKIQLPSITNHEGKRMSTDDLKKFTFYTLQVTTPAGTKIEMKL